ncbi:MAG TPA: hypothetical protein VNV41_08070 [Candidatus Acidoferrales bacterium]|nr:hypothetical protein [Candidatus Acidoferrales bacterium]
MIKPTEVSLLFGKWKEEFTVVRVIAYLPCGYFGLNSCRILASPTRLTNSLQ